MGASLCDVPSERQIPHLADSRAVNWGLAFGDPVVGNATVPLLEGDAQFEPCEVGPQATMRTGPECEVAIHPAAEVDFAALRAEKGWANVALVACGGNVDLEVLSRALSG